VPSRHAAMYSAAGHGARSSMSMVRTAGPSRGCGRWPRRRASARSLRWYRPKISADSSMSPAERGVESGLDGPGGGLVGLGRFGVQGEQQVQAGDAGNGRAPRDAAVEVGALQLRGVERIGDPGAGRLDQGGERCRYAAQRAFTSDRPVLGQAPVAHACVTHAGTLPRVQGSRERISQVAGETPSRSLRANTAPGT
jgi:hypothetical protein